MVSLSQGDVAMSCFFLEVEVETEVGAEVEAK